MKRIIFAAAMLFALANAGSAQSAPAQPSCSYAEGIITVSDFPNQGLILDVIDVGTNTVTTEYWIMFHNSTTFDVPDPTAPTLYQFRKSTGQQQVIAECSGG